MIMPSGSNASWDLVQITNLTQEWLQNITGTRIKLNKRRTRKLLEKRFKDLRHLLQESNLAELWKLDENERKDRYIHFINAYFKIIFDLPNEQNPLALLMANVSSFFEADKMYKFLQNTNYIKYKELLFNIIRMVYADVEKFRSVKTLSRSIPSDEFFSTTQYALSISGKVDFLNKDHKRLNETIVREYISTYRDFGAYMEKIVRVLVAVQEILRNNEVNLSEIRKYNTNNNVEKLKADSKFRKLLAPFNIIVWNACKHPSWQIKPHTKSVEFPDNQNSVTWKYETLKQQTCEIYASIYILSHFEDALNLYAIQKLVE